MKIDMQIQELREIMYKAIDRYGHASKEALVASQNLDKCMNNYYRKNN